MGRLLLCGFGIACSCWVGAYGAFRFACGGCCLLLLIVLWLLVLLVLVLLLLVVRFLLECGSVGLCVLLLMVFWWLGC